jgi:glucose-1-phosphate thymidylyltransferase
MSKQLLPVYDKPMIYYPISTLMLAGVREILIITTPADKSNFEQLLGDGTSFGVSIEYAIQPKPEGIAQALLIAENFLGSSSCLVILGDNIFHGAGLGSELRKALPKFGAHIFTYEVADPSQYGVLEVDTSGNPISVEEKPKSPASKMAITGLYFFDQEAVTRTRKIKPSSRGELEITTLIESYLHDKKLTYTPLTRGTAWLDTGNPKALDDASTFIRVIEERTGHKIGCIEEISWRNGWLSKDDLKNLAKKFPSNSYGIYLNSLT